MPREEFTLSLTERQAEALHALASLEDLPPEVYAAKVLVKNPYDAYTQAIKQQLLHREDAKNANG